jgi:thiol:disulfide interchange protein
MRRFLLLALFPTLIPGAAAVAATSSADAAHLHVQLVVPERTLNPGGPADAGVYFKLEPGWHVYWKNAGDSGEPPRLHWTLPEGITAGNLQFPAPKRLPLGPLMDFGYEDEVLFPLTLNVAKNAKPGPTLLHAKVDWLVCREVCIPGKAELEVPATVADHPAKSAAVGEDENLYKRLLGRLPEQLPTSAKAVFAPTATGFRLAILTGRPEASAQFFPDQQSIIDNPAPQTASPVGKGTAQGIVLDLKKDANLAAAPAKLTGVIELSNGRAYEIAAVPGPVPAASATVKTSALDAAKFAGLAFLGGIILNLMPCVFPVLFLKGLALVNSSGEERHTQRNHGLVYTAGIVVSFWALVGVLLALRATGALLGWGFQLQSPVFVALTAGLLFFLGLSLAGQFEVGLTLTSAGGSLAQKQGYAGSFFTGVLAVVVATPCTAPLMGPAVGFALTQSALVTFAIFTALALGLAAPYLLLTFQPAWTSILPNPGAWMEVLKQATAVPIFATVIWLAWVLAQTRGATGVAALLAMFLLLAIAGWILGRWPARRIPSLVAGLVIVAAIAASIYGVHSLATPVAAGSVADAGAGSSRWEPWSQAAVDKYRAAGRPVFVDFTASWCLSCQVNERVALRTTQVDEAFRKANVALLKADWTEHDDAISQVLTSYGRSGVPAYALYTPAGDSPTLLPEVLTPGTVIDALKALPAATSASTQKE